MKVILADQQAVSFDCPDCYGRPRQLCPNCGQIGPEDIEPPIDCPRCHGSGQIGGSGTGTLAAYCSTCGGTGRQAIDPPSDSPMVCATCGKPAACYHTDGRPFCIAHCALGHRIEPPFVCGDRCRDDGCPFDRAEDAPADCARTVEHRDAVRAFGIEPSTTSVDEINSCRHCGEPIRFGGRTWVHVHGLNRCQRPNRRYGYDALPDTGVPCGCVMCTTYGEMTPDVG